VLILPGRPVPERERPDMPVRSAPVYVAFLPFSPAAGAPRRCSQKDCSGWPRTSRVQRRREPLRDAFTASGRPPYLPENHLLGAIA